MSTKTQELQRWRGQWCAHVDGLAPGYVQLSRRWTMPAAVGLFPARASRMPAPSIPADKAPGDMRDRWEAMCTLDLEEFAKEPPHWIVEVEGSERARELWLLLCDDVADRLLRLAEEGGSDASV